MRNMLLAAEQQNKQNMPSSHNQNKNKHVAHTGVPASSTQQNLPCDNLQYHRYRTKLQNQATQHLATVSLRCSTSLRHRSWLLTGPQNQQHE
jgi:hypothetical protein